MSDDLNQRMALPAEPWPEYHRGKLFGRWVSSGKDFVLVESLEGQAILNENVVPANQTAAAAKLAFVITAVCILSLIAFAAFAQTAPSDRIKLEITRADLNVIGQGIMKLPFETAAPLLNNLQAQLGAADRAAAKAASDAAAAKVDQSRPASANAPTSPDSGDPQ